MFPECINYKKYQKNLTFSFTEKYLNDKWTALSSSIWKLSSSSPEYIPLLLSIITIIGNLYLLKGKEYGINIKSILKGKTISKKEEKEVGFLLFVLYYKVLYYKQEYQLK